MAASRTEPSPGESESSKNQPAAAAEPLLGVRPGRTPVAIAIVAIVAAVFVWWAWKQGAYFESVFLPGAIILYGLLILLLVAAPFTFKGRLNGPVRVALAAIVALAGWTLLSIAWTPVKDAAVQDAERALLYAAVFFLGLWSCNLAGRRMLLPLAAVAAAGTAIGLVVTVTLASGTDVASWVHSVFSGPTLRFPIGYRNAEGAFLLICLWPIIVLAAEGELPWQLRASLVGAATMLMEIAVLAQSRGSLPAAIVALAVFLALSPRRLRAATFLCLAGVPMLFALPTLLDVYQYEGGGGGLIPLLRDTSRAIALTSLGSVVLAAVFIRGVEFRLKLGRQTIQRISWAAAVTAIAVVAVGGTVFVAERGGPIEFVDQRVSEFERGGNPDLSPQGTRFGANVGSNRGDFWRVALDQGQDNPLHGGGAGSFAVTYLQDRDSSETPNDPHSVELLMLGELGLVGFALFATFIVSVAVAGMRSRRLGRAAAALAAGSLTAGAYWLMHASYDWFWHYPALTAPVMFLLGAACAPRILDVSPPPPSRGRWAAVAVLGVGVLVAIPLFLSQRYATRAYDEWPSNAGAAFSDLDRAQSLNPFDSQLPLAEGVIATRIGDRDRAIDAFRDAIDLEPEGYAGHYFLARALQRTDPAAARAEVAEALRLNPLDPQLRRLDRRLQRRP